MRVVVTGGAGFIGSHLVDRYLLDGHEVIAVDNLCTGSLANLRDASANRRFTFLPADVRLTILVEGPVDLVLHFASPASPIDYARLALETLAVNSRGTELACDLAERHRARLVFASTSEVYGDPTVHPQVETYWGNVNPIGPRACYDEAKRFGEALVTTRMRLGPLDARIVRIFNTYGPRMRAEDGRVVPSLLTQALAGEPLTIYGDGSQTRSFTFVDDLVEGIVRLAGHDEARGAIVNLGNTEETSIRRFAELVAELAGVPLTIEPRPLPTDDPSRRRPDIGRARALLGWEPRVPLREGLSRTIAWWREHRAPNPTKDRMNPGRNETVLPGIFG
jgi:nucleoside-diphosphate-sugar epimerase